MSNLKFIYDGGASKRYHTVDTLRTQDIAAHSFGVAWFCELLTAGAATKNLIMAALAHDLAEHQCGDIPSPAKRAMNLSSFFAAQEGKVLAANGVGKYEQYLTDEELRTLKTADMMDGMMFCIRERELGNTKVEFVYNNFMSYAMEVVTSADVLAHNLLMEINDNWVEAINEGK